MPAREHVASASITVDGRRIDPEHMDLVEKIEVRNFRGLPDMATVRMADPEGQAGRRAAVLHRRRDRDPARRARRATSPRPSSSARSSRYEPEFTSAAATICVRAYDASHRMHRNRRSATYQDMTVARHRPEGRRPRTGCRPATLESTSTVHPFLQQSMETDLDFLSRLAATENCEVGVADGKVFLAAHGKAARPRARRSTGARTSCRSSRA